MKALHKDVQGTHLFALVLGLPDFQWKGKGMYQELYNNKVRVS